RFEDLLGCQARPVTRRTGPHRRAADGRAPPPPGTGYSHMTLSAAERAAISRQNGQKSTGPRSAEGKARSRFNALKHGLKAKLPVLPGEDPQEYQGRLDAWIADLKPQNDVEHSLVERAVTITWQLDRAERAETARLTRIIREAPAEAARRREEEAA